MGFTTHEVLLAPALAEAPLSFDQICGMIDATGWSFQFNREQTKTLARYAKSFIARKGEVIVREGARELYMCFVLAGSVDVLKNTATGEMKIVTLGKGQVFGEMGLIEGEARSATVVAATETILMVLDHDGFLQFAEEHPDLGFRLTLKIAKMLSQRLRRANQGLVDAAADGEDV
jgi:CRP/FNR family transcriptional regulator, cyclic AMP receptor protein